ncbi:inositol monophosphatase 1-like isoform X2 [Phycodurus eques]|uniref:inositol monophosphatase 1-like isoform X2 n=1 Tax=Phycodurus eques TaxID=693459 RepID=UPI002ACD71EA|nr:inositol monophosphatase 1-like isoform X2 [Phycodurus eques]
MSDPWQECLEHCVEVATQAGKVIREGLKSDIAVMHKSSQVDLVTETDQRVERLIISSIKAKFPTHSFIGEESVAAGAPSVLTDDPTWIIDPIDGTTNFVHGFPFVCVSIGFTVKKQIEFGVVYSCIEDKMYTARKGKGAYCNGVPIKVSGQEGPAAVRRHDGKPQERPDHPRARHPLAGKRRRQHVPGGERRGRRVLPRGHPLLGHGRRRGGGHGSRGSRHRRVRWAVRFDVPPADRGQQQSGGRAPRQAHNGVPRRQGRRRWLVNRKKRNALSRLTSREFGFRGEMWRVQPEE